PRGIVAQRDYDDGHWKKLTKEQRDSMLYLRHGFLTEPHFVAFWVTQLPAPAPWIARNIFGCPLLTWTVRTPEQRARAAQYADQMIFEGFRPEPYALGASELVRAMHDLLHKVTPCMASRDPVPDLCWHHLKLRSKPFPP